MPKPWWRAGAVVAFCSTLGAQAAAADELAEICTCEQQPFVSPAFERLDLDADGRLTPDEAAGCAALDAVYSRLDLDADRVLTRAEYRGFAAVWRRRLRTLGDDAAEQAARAGRMTRVQSIVVARVALTIETPASGPLLRVALAAARCRQAFPSCAQATREILFVEAHRAEQSKVCATKPSRP